MKITDLCKYIDHSCLKPEVTSAIVKKFCQEAIKYNFVGLCVNSFWVSFARKILENSKVKLISTIDFPLGQSSLKSKIYQMKQALSDGAQEIDFVNNISLIKDQKWSLLGTEFRNIRAEAPGVTLKVILETNLLTSSEIRKVTEIAVVEKLDFVKTSTGWIQPGAKTEALTIMLEATKNSPCQVKASGGLDNFEKMVKFVEMGVTRLGSSRMVNFLTNQNSLDPNY